MPPTTAAAAAIWGDLDEPTRQAFLGRFGQQRSFEDPSLALLAVAVGDCMLTHVEATRHRVHRGVAVGLAVALALAVTAVLTVDADPVKALVLAVVLPAAAFVGSTVGFALNLSGLQRYVDLQRGVARAAGPPSSTGPEELGD